MKEHGILFSTMMVQALLAGIKKQTRRLRGLEQVNENPDNWELKLIRNDGELPGRKVACFTGIGVDSKDIKGCLLPYSVGDILWVKETHGFIDGNIVYKADNPAQVPEKWKPSIFMPKLRARTWLRITDVRVQRLQSISEEDAKAEGVHLLKDGKHYADYAPFNNNIIKKLRLGSPVRSFFSLWASINGEASLNKNPWVVAYTFEQVKTPQP